MNGENIKQLFSDPKRIIIVFVSLLIVASFFTGYSSHSSNDTPPPHPVPSTPFSYNRVVNATIEEYDSLFIVSGRMTKNYSFVSLSSKNPEGKIDLLLRDGTNVTQAARTLVSDGLRVTGRARLKFSEPIAPIENVSLTYYYLTIEPTISEGISFPVRVMVSGVGTTVLDASIIPHKTQRKLYAEVTPYNKTSLFHFVCSIPFENRSHVNEDTYREFFATFNMSLVYFNYTPTDGVLTSSPLTSNLSQTLLTLPFVRSVEQQRFIVIDSTMTNTTYLEDVFSSLNISVSFPDSTLFLSVDAPSPSSLAHSLPLCKKTTPYQSMVVRATDTVRDDGGNTFFVRSQPLGILVLPLNTTRALVLVTAQTYGDVAEIKSFDMFITKIAGDVAPDISSHT